MSDYDSDSNTNHSEYQNAGMSSIISSTWLPNMNASIEPMILEVSGSYEDEKAVNLLDEDENTRWNAGHLGGWDVDNWVVFDFGQQVRITEFSLRSCGDIIHDPKRLQLQTSTKESGPWRSIASFKAKGGTTSWQAFQTSGVSQYFRLNISERHTRYQTYLCGIRFRTSFELGRFEYLTQVEREFLRRSLRADVYPNERIGVIETSNVADLGQLTALTFLEWIIENPHGVIGLPTGKTPELFIKWLKYYQQNWTKPQIQQEMREFGVINELNCDELNLTEQFPSTADLTFVQLDEFFPISIDQHNSFGHYIRTYYLKTLNLKPENCLTMDFSQLPVFQTHDMHKVFPGDKINIKLRDREPRGKLEVLQKQALKELDEFCAEYERRIRELGGYGFFLGGIGHDGHIAFNFRSCDPNLGTRLVILNYETAAQSAGDFGGITNTRNKAAVTVGLATITYNNNARCIIMAAGEKKAIKCKEAIMLAADRKRPSSVLHALPRARFYLTQGSAIYLTDRRTEDIRRACENGSISKKQMYHCVCELGLRIKKRVIHLTANDFLSDAQAHPIYCYWTKQSQPITSLTRQVRDYLVNMIERGCSIPAGVRLLHTSPHHDDVMLAYHEIMSFLFKHNENFFCYVTSGFNSCPDKYIVNVLRKLNLQSQKHITKYIDRIVDPNFHLEDILKIFVRGFLLKNDALIDESEILFVLRRVRQVFNHEITNQSTLKNITEMMQKENKQQKLGRRASTTPTTNTITEASDEDLVTSDENEEEEENKEAEDEAVASASNADAEADAGADAAASANANAEEDEEHDSKENDGAGVNEIQVLNAAAAAAAKESSTTGVMTAKRLISYVRYLLNEYFPAKLIGAHDSPNVQFLKGCIRESECDRMWAILGCNPKTNVFHLRSKFYTPKFFTDQPTVKDDAQPMLDLYQQLQPDYVTVAFDPEGTGPDTHYKVLQVVAQALRLGRDSKVDLQPTIWGYRNVWHRFQLCYSSLAIPITAQQMTEMHLTFMHSFGCQKKAEFPSPEYDGPFSVLSHRFHRQQLHELKTLLGSDYFDRHWNEQIVKADAIILLDEMSVDEFLAHADDLRSRIEIHQTI